MGILSPLRFLKMKSIYFYCIPIQADVARGLFKKKKEKKKNTTFKYKKKIRAQLSVKTAKISDLK